LLNRERCVYRSRGSLEYRENRVPSHVDDAALIRFDVAFEGRPTCIESSDRRLFIGRHEARVACRVRREDRRKSRPEFSAAHSGQPFEAPSPIDDTPGYYFVGRESARSERPLLAYSVKNSFSAGDKKFQPL
jgi:hypothetical protein